MSAGAVFQHAVRTVVRCEFGDVCSRDVLSALEAARPGSPLGFFYELASELALPRHIALARGAALYFAFAAGNLADDLADGDCTYLEAPHATGPCAQFLLQNLFVTTLLDAGVDPATLARATRDLARAAALQHVEVRTTRFSARSSRAVAEGLAGLQYAAYLELLLDGTGYRGDAHGLGFSMGIAAHVAKDAVTRDKRFWDLAPDERVALIDWALAHAAQASVTELVSVALVIGEVRATLEALRATEAFRAEPSEDARAVTP
jgi:hypothetical protein